MRTLVSLLLTCAVAAAGDYVVLDAGFPKAAARLASHRKAQILPLDPENPEALLGRLKRLAPRHVALVMRPEAIDFNFQRRFLQMATELDPDPFVDFAFGYITGANEKEALAFVERCIAAEGKRRVPALGKIICGLDRSGDRRSAYTLRGASFPVRRFQVAGEKAFPTEGRDRAYVAKALRGVRGLPAVMFVGHGWPAEIVGGPETEDLAGAVLEGTVVFNVACYTGVTNAYFERDWRAGKMVRKKTPLGNSFCLAVLRAGTCGYTAYLCPRPAGPELDCDLLDVMIRGESLGTARRRDYDKTVLGFLGYGKRMALAPIPIDAPLGRVRDAVREMMLEGATGGVVFGDPALKAFKPQPEAHPVRVEVKRGSEGIRVALRCLGSALFLLCNDPTAKFGKSMAHKAVARVPLRPGERIRSVAVRTLRVGGREVGAGLVWAIEEDHGDRFLHVKVVWPRGGSGDLEAEVSVQTAKGGHDVASWGRVAARIDGKEVELPETPPTLLEVAGRHKVSRKAIDMALAASDAELGRGSIGAVAARRKLARFGREGFRAVCCLIEVGRIHYRTVNLLAATYQRGDEKYLIALAGLDLPNSGTWVALEGLGVTESAKARRYLLRRLQSERDPGEFMSAAQGLARMKERKAIKPVGEQILKFEDGWNGVAGTLFDVLAALGGPAAVHYLEKYCLDERATLAAKAQAALRSIDPEAADRVRKAKARR